MMRIVGAAHHLLIVSDQIDAVSHRHSFVQVALSLGEPFVMETQSSVVRSRGVALDSLVLHSLDCRSQIVLMLLIDSASDLADSVKRRIAGSGWCELTDNEVEAAATYYAQHGEEIADVDSYSQMLSGLLQCCSIHYIQPPRSDERISGLIRLLKQESIDTWSIPALAQHVHLSPSRLSHLFKEDVGIPLSGYLVLNKLQQALYQILSGVPITDAALQSGFDSPSHLAGVSKRLLGMTASEIRRDSVFLQVEEVGG